MGGGRREKCAHLLSGPFWRDQIAKLIISKKLTGLSKTKAREYEWSGVRRWGEVYSGGYWGLKNMCVREGGPRQVRGKGVFRKIWSGGEKGKNGYEGGELLGGSLRGEVSGSIRELTKKNPF